MHAVVEQSSQSTRAAQPIGNPWWGLIPACGYLLLVCALPVGYLLSASFRATQGTGLDFAPGWTLEHYRAFFSSASNGVSYLRSLGIAMATVAVSTLLAYPLAYTLAFVVPKSQQKFLLFCTVAPFWTSFVIRAFAWQLLLAERGPLNSVLSKVGVGPVEILYTHAATLLGLTAFGTMLIALNLFAVMESIPPNYLAAAADLGARRWQSFWTVIVPLSLPGLGIGALLTFILAFGDYIVPTLLGGGLRTVLAQTMHGAISTSFNVPRAATYAAVMLATILTVSFPVLVLTRSRQEAHS